MRYFLSNPQTLAAHCERVLVRPALRYDPGTLAALRKIVAAEEFGYLTDWEITFARDMAQKRGNSSLSPKQHNVAYRIVQTVRHGRVRDAERA